MKTQTISATALYFTVRVANSEDGKQTVVYAEPKALPLLAALAQLEAMVKDTGIYFQGEWSGEGAARQYHMEGRGHTYRLVLSTDMATTAHGTLACEGLVLLKPEATAKYGHFFNRGDVVKQIANGSMDVSVFTAEDGYKTIRFTAEEIESFHPFVLESPEAEAIRLMNKLNTVARFGQPDEDNWDAKFFHLVDAVSSEGVVAPALFSSNYFSLEDAVRFNALYPVHIGYSQARYEAALEGLEAWVEMLRQEAEECYEDQRSW